MRSLLKALLLTWLTVTSIACGGTLPLAQANISLTASLPVPLSTATATGPFAIPPDATSTTQPSPCTSSTESISLARQHLIHLSETIGSRQTGTPREAQAAAYIESAFSAIGYLPSVQTFSFNMAERGKVKSANISAVKEGLSPRLVIIGAHYDSVPLGHGADDNASGVAVMLEVARLVKDTPTPYTIRFVAFGAEEVHMQGSSYYVKQMSRTEIATTIVMINLDSLIAGDIAYVYGNAAEKGAVRDWALAAAQQMGFDLRTQAGENPRYPPGTTGDWGDSYSFSRAGIPYAYFESTNWSLGDKDGYVQVAGDFGEGGQIWHTPYDNLTYIEASFPGRIDERLRLFTNVLCYILTEFTL